MSNHGGYRPGAGRKKKPHTQIREAIDKIDIPRCIHNLEIAAQGKPVICPHCKQNTNIKTCDTVALQANVELINRVLGKPKQTQEIDITQTIVLTADQIESYIRKLIRENAGKVIALLREEGIYEVKMLGVGKESYN